MIQPSFNGWSYISYSHTHLPPLYRSTCIARHEFPGLKNAAGIFLEPMCFGSAFPLVQRSDHLSDNTRARKMVGFRFGFPAPFASNGNPTARFGRQVAQEPPCSPGAPSEVRPPCPHSPLKGKPEELPSFRCSCFWSFKIRYSICRKGGPCGTKSERRFLVPL